MKKALLILAIAITVSQQAKAQLLAVDFNRSSNIKDYQSSTPNPDQFNVVATTGGDTKVAINDNRLRFTRIKETDFGYFLRTINLATLPSKIMVKFDVSVSGNDSGAAQISAAIFQLGDGFADGINPISKTTQELNVNTHSRLGISLSNVEGQFFIRDYNLNKNSAPLTGIQTVTWFINNTGATVTYVTPDQKTDILGADRSDIWVGNVKVANEQASPGGLDKDLKNFKFSFLKGKGVIDIDNISITDISNEAK